MNEDGFCNKQKIYEQCQVGKQADEQEKPIRFSVLNYFKINKYLFVDNI